MAWHDYSLCVPGEADEPGLGEKRRLVFKTDS